MLKQEHASEVFCSGDKEISSLFTLVGLASQKVKVLVALRGISGGPKSKSCLGGSLSYTVSNTVDAVVVMVEVNVGSLT
jgi:hypothetical protein